MSGGERDKPVAPDDGSTIEFIAMRSVREPAPEAAFAFTADALAGVELRVVAADVHEGLNELYEAAIELCTSDPALDVHALLGARAALEIKRGQRKRRVCGVVRRVERMDSAGGRRRVKVALVPALWALSQRTFSIFWQDSTPTGSVPHAGVRPTIAALTAATSATTRVCRKRVMLRIY